MASPGLIRCASRRERQAVEAKVQLRRLGSERWEFEGRTTDLSLHGLGAEIPAVFAVGEVVEMRFCDAEDEIVNRLRVAYRNNMWHYGMQFVGR